MKDKFTKQKEALERRIEELKRHKKDKAAIEERIKQYPHLVEDFEIRNVEASIKKTSEEIRNLQKKLGDQFKEVLSQI